MWALVSTPKASRSNPTPGSWSSAHLASPAAPRLALGRHQGWLLAHLSQPSGPAPLRETCQHTHGWQAGRMPLPTWQEGMMQAMRAGLLSLFAALRTMSRSRSCTASAPKLLSRLRGGGGRGSGAGRRGGTPSQLPPQHRRCPRFLPQQRPSLQARLYRSESRLYSSGVTVTPL